MHSVFELENIIIMRHYLTLYNLILACPLTFKLNFMAKWFYSNDHLHSKFLSLRRVAKNNKKNFKFIKNKRINLNQNLITERI